jgi:hypothetical protein
MIYQMTLPSVFPYYAEADQLLIRGWILLLIDTGTRDDTPFGSSFAVTVELGSTWRLWLSETSAKYLAKHSNVNIYDITDFDRLE